MPELPEMQALAERLDAALASRRLEAVSVLGFSGLKTVVPGPDDLVGRRLEGVDRRGKYLRFHFEGALTVALHLSQGGRVDLEDPPKETKPRGSVVRFSFEGPLSLLVREHGTQRKVGWWVLASGDEGPMGKLGPEVTDASFDDMLAKSDDNRHIHTVLRDQRFVAGVGRGYADDALNRARFSPFSSLRSLSASQRLELLSAVRSVMDEALVEERTRTGALSAAKLGERFSVHNRAGQPCPQCGAELRRVSYESYEITYCPQCQTGGRLLADRRLSRLLR